MAVYVDDARIRAWVPGRGSGSWSHLWADSDQELMAFGQRLGMRRRWLQAGSLLHYEVVEWKRRKAIRLGAIPLAIGSAAWLEHLASARQRQLEAVQSQSRRWNGKASESLLSPAQRRTRPLLAQGL